MDAPDSLLTVREISELLKVNQQTVRNWIDAGTLPHVRVGQRRVCVRQSALDAFIEGDRSGVPKGPSASEKLDHLERRVDDLAAELQALRNRLGDVSRPED